MDPDIEMKAAAVLRHLDTQRYPNARRLEEELEVLRAATDNDTTTDEGLAAVRNYLGETATPGTNAEMRAGVHATLQSVAAAHGYDFYAKKPVPQPPGQTGGTDDSRLAPTNQQYEWFNGQWTPVAV